jgi:hypothetical protein
VLAVMQVLAKLPAVVLEILCCCRPHKAQHWACKSGSRQSRISCTCTAGTSAGSDAASAAASALRALSVASAASAVASAVRPGKSSRSCACSLCRHRSYP